MIPTSSKCSSFEYSKGQENILIGKTGKDNKFKVKRIIVIQMYGREERKRMNEERRCK